MSSEDLTLDSWSELTDSYPFGGATGAETSYTHTGIDPGISKLFYRIREDQ